MKVGVCVFQNRISPRLDQSREVRVFEVAQGGSSPLRYVEAIHWQDETVSERAKFLRSQGVGNLICGAAEPWMEEHFRNRGIHLYSWVSGSLEEILEALAGGDLIPFPPHTGR